jgi:hypothetical protein
MTDPAFLGALDQAIARTGVERYRFLCLEHSDPAVRADYQRLVTEIAAGTHTGDRYDPAVHGEPSRTATSPAGSRPCCDAPDPYAR